MHMHLAFMASFLCSHASQIVHIMPGQYADLDLHKFMEYIYIAYIYHINSISYCII